MIELYFGVGGGAVFVVLGYWLLALLIARGVMAADRNELEDSPTDYGVEFESVEFPSRRGDVTLDGWYIAGQTGMPSVVYVHGISATRTACGMTAVAADLNRRGFGALLFDLRAHGLSGGKRMSGGWYERFDVLGAYDFLVERGVPPHKIGVVGLSMGAGAVVLAAVEEPGIRAVVLDSPYARSTELISQETAIKLRIPTWLAAVFKPGAELLARKVYDIDIGAMAPVESVALLDYPVLVIHGATDDRVPIDHGRRVWRAAPEGSPMWEVSEAGHNEASTENRSEYGDRVADYLLSRIGVE